MKKLIYLIVSLFVLSVIATFAVPKTQLGSSFNPQLYPNPQLTPGVIATTDFKELTSVLSCGTYSACHRKTTDAVKIAVCKEYPMNCKGVKEIDHFIPLALGGQDSLLNLWAQPAQVMINGKDRGFHTKDRLESYLVIQMKAGKIAPKDAQQCLQKDWVRCYEQHLERIDLGAAIVDPDN